MGRPLYLYKQEFETPHKTAEDCVRESVAMRQNMTEDQIDKILADSFPCSDPPAWY